MAAYSNQIHAPVAVQISRQGEARIPTRLVARKKGEGPSLIEQNRGRTRLRIGCYEVRKAVAVKIRDGKRVRHLMICPRQSHRNQSHFLKAHGAIATIEKNSHCALAFVRRGEIRPAVTVPVRGHHIPRLPSNALIKDLFEVPLTCILQDRDVSRSAV